MSNEEILLIDKEAVKRFMGFKRPNTDGLLRVSYTTWNDVMPVVEKIRDLGFDVELTMFFGDEKQNRCQIVTSDNELLINGEGETGETTVQRIFKTCVQFIKWYNSQPKPQN